MRLRRKIMAEALKQVVTPAVERELKRFEAARGSLPGASQAWVEQFRTNAVEHFARTGFPTTRIESWKYTDLRHVFRNEFSGAPGNIEDFDTPSLLPEGDGPVVTFVDGVFSQSLSSIGKLADGVRVLPLSQALDAGDRGLEETLGTVAALDSPTLAGLNAAMMQDGAYIDVSDEVELAAPVRIVCLTSNGFCGAAHLRHVIRLGRNARATVLQAYFGTDGAIGLSNTVTECRVEDGAALNLIKRQEEDIGAWHMGLVAAEVGRDASFDAFTLSSGGRTARNEIRVTLAGEGANARLNGLALGRGRQHCDNTTDILHAVPQGTSGQLYKSVVDDSARSVFLGRIEVAPDAQKTDARQMNRSLLLSPSAQADSKPELIIHADDVKCAHGATVGDLDEEAMFYLRSRGVSRREARGLLVQAFAGETLENVEDETIMKWLEDGLLRWLEQSDEKELAA